MRPCTCHRDDRPPFPCAQKYALRDCLAVALQEGYAEDVRGMIRCNDLVPLGYPQAYALAQQILAEKGWVYLITVDAWLSPAALERYKRGDPPVFTAEDFRCPAP